MFFGNIGKKFFLILVILFFSLSNISLGECNLNFLRGGVPKGGAKNPICSNSPDFIDKYFSDNINILNKISGTTNSSKGLNALGAKTLQTILGSVGISTMFGISGMGDFFQNFLILKEDQQVVRDWTKIINFKQYITKKALLASKKGILLENIEKNIINKINSSSSFIIRPGDIKTYKDLLKYLWNNQIAFEKIYYDKIILLNESYEISDGIQKNTKKIVNSNHFSTIISKIEENYFEGQLGPKIKCNTPWDDFVNAIENITCNLGGNKLSKAADRFSCNYYRLLYALNLGGSEGNCGSVKIKPWKKLSDRFKFNASIEGAGKIISNNKGTDNLGKLGKNIKNGISSILNGMKKIGNIILHPIDNTSKIIDSIKYTITNGDNTIINDNYFDKQINNIKEQIKNDYNETTKILTSKEPGEFTNQVTPLFPKISKKIDNIIKKIDGYNGIYELTAKACENQSPFDGDCRY